MKIYDVLKINDILGHTIKYPERNMLKRLKENYLWTHCIFHLSEFYLPIYGNIYKNECWLFVYIYLFIYSFGITVLLYKTNGPIHMRDFT